MDKETRIITEKTNKASYLATFCDCPAPGHHRDEEVREVCDLEVDLRLGLEQEHEHLVDELHTTKQVLLKLQELVSHYNIHTV